MKLQEAFDKVANHLIQQNRRAVEENGTCVYLADNGDMCAIGCLLPEGDWQHYQGGVEDLVAEWPYLHDFLRDADNDSWLHAYSYLQSIHDDASSWGAGGEGFTPRGARRLVSLAEGWGLDAPETIVKLAASSSDGDEVVW